MPRFFTPFGAEWQVTVDSDVVLSVVESPVSAQAVLATNNSFFLVEHSVFQYIAMHVKHTGVNFDALPHALGNGAKFFEL